jgi:flagellar hook-associated protein 3 FlgL
MSIGRVSTQHLTSQLLDNIQSQMNQQQDLFQQISSSKRIHKPSDDPTGISKVMNLNDQLQRVNQYESTISTAEVWTNVTYVAVDSATSTWKRVNELGIAAADGTKTASDRAGMAEELEQLLQHMVQTSNSTHSGRYIFGGSKTESPPFTVEKDPNTGSITKVNYGGDSTIRRVKTNDQGTTGLNLLGSNAGNPDAPGVFQDSNANVDLFETVIELRDKLLSNDTVGISGSGGTLEAIERGAQSLTSALVRIGGVQEVLRLDKNRTIEDSSNVEQFLSEIEDADIAALILELNNIQSVYEAALAMGGRINQKGLLNYI